METSQENSQPVADETNDMRFIQIRKRDGRLVPFDARKIELAILKAARATDEFDEAIAQKMTIRVLSLAQMTLSKEMPTVEEIQDLVEDVLQSSLFKKTAKAYILYRDQHARNREMIQKAGVNLMDNYLNRQDWEVQENPSGYAEKNLKYWLERR